MARRSAFAASVCALLLCAACGGKLDTSTSTGAGGTGSQDTSGAGRGSASADDAPSSGGGGGFAGSTPSGGSDSDQGSADGLCFRADIGPKCSKDAASSLCTSKGYDIASITSTATSCTVTCCPRNLPPPPPPPLCVYDVVGDGSTCLSFGDLKSKADALCDSHKLMVQTLSTANDCPGGATIAKVSCCGYPPKK